MFQRCLEITATSDGLPHFSNGNVSYHPRWGNGWSPGVAAAFFTAESHSRSPESLRRRFSVSILQEAQHFCCMEWRKAPDSRGDECVFAPSSALPVAVLRQRVPHACLLRSAPAQMLPSCLLRSAPAQMLPSCLLRSAPAQMLPSARMKVFAVRMGTSIWEYERPLRRDNNVSRSLP